MKSLLICLFLIATIDHCVSTAAAWEESDSAPNSKGQESLSKFEAVRPAMGVKFRIIVYAEKPELARKAFLAAFERIDQLNSIFSDYDPNSESCRLTAVSRIDEFSNVSDELWQVLNLSQKINKQTDGAFDVSIGNLTKLWKSAIRAQALPQTSAILAARKSSGMELLELNPDSKQVRLKASNVRLDFGGIAKGYAADEALRVMFQHGLRQSFVDASGDIAIGDAPPGRDGWHVQVASMDRNPATAEVISVVNCGVATSGEAYQFVEIDGQRFSHIVDPRTGYGITGCNSVTVVAPSAAEADAFASAMSVMGIDGISKIEKLRDIQAFAVSRTAGKNRTAQTKAFNDLKTIKAGKLDTTKQDQH